MCQPDFRSGNKDKKYLRPRHDVVLWSVRQTPRLLCPPRCRSHSQCVASGQRLSFCCGGESRGSRSWRRIRCHGAIWLPPRTEVSGAERKYWRDQRTDRAPERDGVIEHAKIQNSCPEAGCQSRLVELERRGYARFVGLAQFGQRPGARNKEKLCHSFYCCRDDPRGARTTKNSAGVHVGGGTEARD